MALVVRRSILKGTLIVVWCMVAVCFYGQVAWAQHPPGHVAGGGVQVSAPPISHGPVFQAPIYHPPIYRPPILQAPIYHAPISVPRISAVPSAGILGTARFRPPWRPVRPRPPVLPVYFPVIFGEPFWGFNSCWWAACDLFPWTFGYSTVSPYEYGPANYVVTPVYETPVYVYGQERPDLPQLYLKNGTILNVTDYWLVDDQLHFTMIEEDGKQPAEHVIRFSELDLQKTVDVNTRRGFRFVLRNESFEEYLRDHPDAPPALVTLPPK